MHMKSPIHWKEVLRTNFTQVSSLADYLQLSEKQRLLLLTKSDFVLNLPLRLASKITKASTDCPLFLQFVPLKLENKAAVNFILDPVADRVSQKEKKLLHKYQSRTLILTTSACAMHCRYCFRQKFPYETETTQYEKELDYVRNNSSIREVILSGGDPLSLNDNSLKSLLEAINCIPHVDRVRFHTRFLIGIPERVDGSFLETLKSSKKQLIFVLHINHYRELDDTIFEAIKQIQSLGIPTLNQSVLLKGVNDSVDVLSELYWKLTSKGIIPYYLHQLDRVEGTAHFEVEKERGSMLIQQLQNTLPGYAVPKYVEEIPRSLGKTLIPLLP